MYSASSQGMHSYRSIEVETAVHDATPHALVLMLFDGARLAIGNARAQMELKQIAAKGQAIGKAINIIEYGLKASLDMDKGGRIAEQLDALYEYMIERLALANLHNQPAYLDEVARLLAEIEGAWREIGKPAAAPAAGAGSAAVPRTSYAKA